MYYYYYYKIVVVIIIIIIIIMTGLMPLTCDRKKPDPRTKKKSKEKSNINTVEPYKIVLFFFSIFCFLSCIFVCLLFAVYFNTATVLWRIKIIALWTVVFIVKTAVIYRLRPPFLQCLGQLSLLPSVGW